MPSLFERGAERESSGGGRPRIVIAHSWIQTNLGDILMALELARFVGNAFPEVDVFSAVNNPGQASRMHHLAHRYGVRLAGVIADTRRSDLAIGSSVFLSTGGDFLTGQWAIADRVIAQLDTAREQGIPTALCFQTIGPFEDQETLRKLAGLPDLIIARETATVDAAAAVGRSDDVVLAADLAFLLEPAVVAARPAIADHLGVNFRGYLRTYQPASVERFADAVGLPIRAYSTDVELDRPILDDLKARGHLTEPAGYDYRELAQVIAENDSLTLTDRYHGLAYSLLAAIPCISVVSYANSRAPSHKSRGLIELTGLDLPLLDSLEDHPVAAIDRAHGLDRAALVSATERLRLLTLEGLETLSAFIRSAL
jgi:polysaccharide pyruvyl transferase WcaK-like protein